MWDNPILRFNRRNWAGMTREGAADDRGDTCRKIALELLARDGASAVWQLHVVAAKVYQDGGARAAGVLLDIADAAERNLASRVVTQ